MLECNSPSHKLVRSLEEISGVDVLVAPDPGAVSIGRLHSGSTAQTTENQCNRYDRYENVVTFLSVAKSE